MCLIFQVSSSALAYVARMSMPFFILSLRSGRYLVNGSSPFAMNMAQLNFISISACVFSSVLAAWVTMACLSGASFLFFIVCILALCRLLFSCFCRVSFAALPRILHFANSATNVSSRSACLVHASWKRSSSAAFSSSMASAYIPFMDLMVLVRIFPMPSFWLYFSWSSFSESAAASSVIACLRMGR